MGAGRAGEKKAVGQKDSDVADGPNPTAGRGKSHRRSMSVPAPHELTAPAEADAVSVVESSETQAVGISGSIGAIGAPGAGVTGTSGAWALVLHTAWATGVGETVTPQRSFSAPTGS